ncbi:hypothetical protein BGX38DRAFT_1167194 [Terfezia claveryi]|nr:hypothetical protein BGX38DRAFT_1167194 [Terfezia claveryi]
MSSTSRTPPRPAPDRSSVGSTPKPPTLQIQSPPITPPTEAPPIERSASVASDSSTLSKRYSFGLARTNTGEMKRRGFSRPEGTEFSNSARSRESVMALGSIQHLQYFFAKTGLLDGKGGGLKKKGNTSDNSRLSVDAASLLQDSTYSSMRSSPDFLVPFDAEHEFFSESPSEEFDIDEAFMLPPTTSTYNLQMKPVPPAPNPDMLRKKLREALTITKRRWEESIPEQIGDASKGGVDEKEIPQGVYDIHCTELTDLATSAVRAARGYYYTTDISLLSSKDEKTLREEFLFVLDVLKRMVQRKFEGGVQIEERDHVIDWIKSVEVSLDEEERDIAEMKRLGRQWLEGDWTGKYAHRNHLFMSYFDSSTEKLPEPEEITPETSLPTSFLKTLQTGLHLILIHNNVVRRSKRPFGQIPQYHTEFSKPYRLADNLRYWRKAAELRWEVKLKFDVMAVVSGTNGEAWREFNTAVELWCETVLKEVRADWEMGEGAAAIGEGAAEAAVRKRARTLTMQSQKSNAEAEAAKSAMENICLMPQIPKDLAQAKDAA